jgi:hypothetical protein
VDGLRKAIQALSNACQAAGDTFRNWFSQDSAKEEGDAEPLKPPLRAKQSVAPAAAAQNSGSSSPKAPNQTAPTAVFLFGRANYFRAIVKVRKCDIFDAGAFAAINLRFENTRLQLAARYGEALFPADKPSGQVREGECDRVTLDSFSNHVAEIEQFLKSQN